MGTQTLLSKALPGLRFRLHLALGSLTLCVGAGAALLFRPEYVPQAAALLRVPPRTLGLVLLAWGLASALALLWLIHGGMLRPLRHLGRELGRDPGNPALDAEERTDEVRWITRRVRRLHEKMQRAEAQLEESHENLRQTEKLALAGKLAAGVAHSIRNPLTGLKLRVFSMTKGMELTERQEEDRTAINDAIRHMEAITSNFLEFSRRPHLSMAPVRISEVVEGTLSLLQPRLEAFQVRVEQHRPDFMPQVDADAEQLREALANLIINACEAMGVGGVLQITEERGQLEPLGRVVVLRISDSGPGVSADMREAVFQPFISTKAEGTGLGLPIAKRIFEEHGGWLHLHSAPGRGATFVCVLPARKDEDVWMRS